MLSLRKGANPKGISEDGLPANKSWDALAWQLRISVGEALATPSVALTAEFLPKAWQLRGGVWLGQFTNPVILFSSGRIQLGVQERSQCLHDSPCYPKQPLREPGKGKSSAQESGARTLSFLAGRHFVSPEKKCGIRAGRELKIPRCRPCQQKIIPFGKIGAVHFIAIGCLSLELFWGGGLLKRGESKSHSTFSCFAFRKFSQRSLWAERQRDWGLYDVEALEFI